MGKRERGPIERRPVQRNIDRLGYMHLLSLPGPTEESLSKCQLGQLCSELNKQHPNRLRQKSSEDGGPYGVWTVKFKDESGIDQGGLFRDSITTIFTELEAVHVQMLVPCPNRRMSAAISNDKFVPNPSYVSARHLEMHTGTQSGRRA